MALAVHSLGMSKTTRPRLVAATTVVGPYVVRVNTSDSSSILRMAIEFWLIESTTRVPPAVKTARSGPRSAMTVTIFP